MDEKRSVNDGDGGGGGGYNDDIYTPIYYLLNAFNNSFPNIKVKFTTTQEIENNSKSPKPKNTYGYDEIPNNLPPKSSVHISLPLNHICNTFLSSVFPQCLKYSVMKTLYNTGERNCISTYRPVSLITSFSKVFEKVMPQRHDNNILVEEKSGFRKNLTA